MNNYRRKMIDRVQTDIQTILGMLENVQSDIEEIKEDEEMCYDNLPESIQESWRGECMQEAIEHFEDAVDNIAECIESLENCDGDLEEAKE